MQVKGYTFFFSRERFDDYYALILEVSSKPLALIELRFITYTYHFKEGFVELASQIAYLLSRLLF